MKSRPGKLSTSITGLIDVNNLSGRVIEVDKSSG